MMFGLGAGSFGRRRGGAAAAACAAGRSRLRRVLVLGAIAPIFAGQWVLAFVLPRPGSTWSPSTQAADPGLASHSSVTSTRSGHVPAGGDREWLSGAGKLITLQACAAIGLAAAVALRRPRKAKDERLPVTLRSRVVCQQAGVAVESGTKCPESVSSGEMPGRYDFAVVEEDLYKWWESAGYFKPEIADKIPKGRGGHESYVVPMPPPNVTGRLHMGHAMFASLQDVLTRFHRMYGHRALWLPGLDHAGIATQMLVERQLVSEGTSRREVGREAFLDRVWSWKADKGGAITDQLRRIGASCDWSREQFTLNEHMSGAVVEAFVRLHEMGVIFRGQRMVNWSPVLQTAVSDLEVEYSEQQGKLYHFKYVVAGQEDEHIPVATTRPETILGDSAVCVHPKDPRYQQFIGREVLVPMQGGRAVPVIADEYVDMEFGTGALKITPAHDFNDFEIAQRHDLPYHSVIALDGSVAGDAVAALGSPQYGGLDRFECRSRLWADMESEGLALKVEDHPQRVPLSERSGEVIEPMLSDQWFVNTEVMAQQALDAVESGDIGVDPERYKKIWRGWLQEKQPWCISRQLWWGHRIPVYYPVGRPGEERYFVARSEEDAKAKAREAFGEDVELRQDPDVLDTWFSSGLWPFATVGWPNEAAPDFGKYYPATILETGYDILFFWVARMVMMGIALTGKAPFREIYLHGLVRDDKGQKMSKTKGNVVDPIESIVEYGTDALRFALLTSSVPGVDTPIGKGALENAKSFANKIWNVGRYIIMDQERNVAAGVPAPAGGLAFTEEEFRALPWIERALLSKCHRVVESVTESLLQNRVAAPTKELKEFVQEDFAAWYLEASKTRLQQHLGGDPLSERGEVAQRVLLYIFEVSLMLLHPFMPFITEAVWQRLPRSSMGSTGPDSLMLRPWLDLSSGKLSDEEAEGWFAKLRTLVSQVRNTRAQNEIPPKEQVALTCWCDNSGFAGALEAEKSALAFLTRADAEKLRVSSFAERPSEAPEGILRTVVSEQLEVDIPAPEKSIDFEKEIARLTKQFDSLSGLLAGTERKITPQFLEKANPVAKEKTLQKKADLEQQKAAVAAQLEELRQLQLRQEEPAPARREALSGLAAGLALLRRPEAAEAGVGEGDALPMGARQEDRIRKGLTKWKELAVKLQGMETIPDDEWENTKGFLRRLYSLKDDMNYLAKGFGKRRKEAEALIEKFQKQVKAADKPAKAKDFTKFMAFQVETQGYLEEFQSYLLDASDDIEVADEEDIDIVPVK